MKEEPGDLHTCPRSLQGKEVTRLEEVPPSMEARTSLEGWDPQRS